MNNLKALLNKAQRDRRVTAKEQGAIVAAATTPYDRQRIKIVLSRGTIKQQKIEFKKQFETVLKPEPDYLPVSDVVGDGFISFDDGNKQGSLGTCTPVAAAWDNIRYQINDNNTWTFKFFNNGSPVFTTVSAERSLIGSTGELGVYERAYAAMLQQTGSVTPGLTAWQEIGNGTSLGDVLSRVKGASYTKIGVPSILDIEAALSVGQTMLIATTGQAPREFVLGDHAYRVVGALDGTVTVRNPWGRDGLSVQGLDDGLITLTTQQFNREFQGGNYAIG